MPINNLKVFYDNFLYILNHKKNVAIECFKKRLYPEMLTHDLSKFKPSEFFPYAFRWFGPDKNSKIIENFNESVKLHYQRNPHHPEHWVDDYTKQPSEMPERHIREMACDLLAMERAGKGSAIEYYKNKGATINMHEKSKKRLEEILIEKIKNKSPSNLQ